MNEVGWNPDRTIMNGSSIYNGTRMSEGVLLCIFLYIQVFSRQKVVLGKIVPEEILK
jgi:hypothetical protein